MSTKIFHMKLNYWLFFSSIASLTVLIQRVKECHVVNVEYYHKMMLESILSCILCALHASPALLLLLEKHSKSIAALCNRVYSMSCEYTFSLVWLKTEWMFLSFFNLLYSYSVNCILASTHLRERESSFYQSHLRSHVFPTVFYWLDAL